MKLLFLMIMINALRAIDIVAVDSVILPLGDIPDTEKVYI